MTFYNLLETINYYSFSILVFLFLTWLTVVQSRLLKHYQKTIDQLTTDIDQLRHKQDTLYSSNIPYPITVITGSYETPPKIYHFDDNYWTPSRDKEINQT